MPTVNWEYTGGTTSALAKAQSFYNGLLMSVYLPTEKNQKVWWVIGSTLTEEGGQPTVEWNVRITGVADGEKEGKLAAENCAEVLLGALGIMRMASRASEKEAAFWRTLRASPAAHPGSVGALLVPSWVKP